jgi:hypothetical protein
VRLVRRAFILVPPGRGRDVFDDYVLRHRAMAARQEPGARFDLPASGSPYPASSLPAQIVQKGADLRLPDHADALELALFEAFFGRSEDVSDPDILSRAAAAAGIDPDQARGFLADAEIEEVVWREHRQAVEQLGITGIPTVLVPGQPPIVGAVPADFYREALRAALEGRRPRPPGGPRLPSVRPTPLSSRGSRGICPGRTDGRRSHLKNHGQCRVCVRVGCGRAAGRRAGAGVTLRDPAGELGPARLP